MSTHEPSEFLRRFAAFPSRLLVFGAFWWILTDGATTWDAWAIGVPAIVAAAATSAALLPPTGWSWTGALRFSAFFVVESVRGALDVARRALAPRMPIAPDVERHALAVEPEFAQVAVANISSLLPGSLAIELDEHRLEIHTLDALHPSARRSVARTEEEIAVLLGLERPKPDARR